MATDSLTPEQIKQVLGFKIDGLKDKEVLDMMYKENPKEIEQKIRHIQQQNAQNFEQQISKYYKNQADKKKNISKIEKEGMTTYKIIFTPDNLTPTQEAYYKVYDPQLYIQTDYEQSVQKSKQAQNPNPSMDLKGIEQTQDLNNPRMQNQQPIHQSHNDQMNINLNPNHHHQNKTKEVETGKGTKQKKKGLAKEQEQKEKLKKEQSLEQYQQETQAQQNDEDRLYCYCRRLYCEGEIMMGCNLCDDDIDVVWFHPICVDKVHNTTFQNLSKEQLEMADFTCGFCNQEFDKIDKYSTKKFV